MSFGQTGDTSDRSDWQLAQHAVWLRGSSHPDEARRFAEQFSEDEVRRVDAYLAAGKPDTGRLASIEAQLADTDDITTDDTMWLVHELKRAWAHLEEARDQVDDAGSLIPNEYVASAIGYVRGTRDTR